MWQRFTSDDVRIIGHYLGVLILFSSFMYALPLVVAVVNGEAEPASRYVLIIGISLVIGSLLRFLRIRPARLNRQQALAVTGLSWLVLALFASIPLFLSGHYSSYLDALFDGVSGLTTTGATTIIDLEHLSYADNMFRFMMHLLGGLGLIVVALSIGLFGKAGASALYSAEARSEHVLPSIVETTQFLAKLSLGMILGATVIITVLCTVSGMSFGRAMLHAFWLSITGFMTGGFAPTSQSVMYYHSGILEFVLMILMIYGSINFVLHAQVWKGNAKAFFGDLETKFIVIWLVVVVIAFTASMSLSSTAASLPSLLRQGLFMTIASFSTTGLQNVTGNQLTTVFTSGAFLILAFAMAVGGGSGSTAGGIKISRLGIIMKSVVATIKETLAPDSARVVVSFNHVGRRVLSPVTVKNAMTVSMLFIFAYCVGTIAGVTYGYDATQAVFEAVAMASNGGLSTIVGPGMPVGLEIIYIIMMWAGRLEFVTLIALVVELIVSLNPANWKRSGQ